MSTQTKPTGIAPKTADKPKRERKAPAYPTDSLYLAGEDGVSLRLKWGGNDGDVGLYERKETKTSNGKKSEKSELVTFKTMAEAKAEVEKRVARYLKAGWTMRKRAAGGGGPRAPKSPDFKAGEASPKKATIVPRAK